LNFFLLTIGVRSSGVAIVILYYCNFICIVVIIMTQPNQRAIDELRAQIEDHFSFAEISHPPGGGGEPTLRSVEVDPPMAGVPSQPLSARSNIINSRTPIMSARRSTSGSGGRGMRGGGIGGGGGAGSIASAAFSGISGVSVFGGEGAIPSPSSQPASVLPGVVGGGWSYARVCIW